jgi:protein-tyrosine phosphatase
VIDLHCHILPALDDGAVDLDDSLAMAAQADADGIEIVCATPHIRHDHDVRIAELPERVASLNGELAARGLRVRVAPGGEVAETIAHRLSPEERVLVSLGGGGRWLLVEPAPGPLSSGLVDLIDDLAAGGLQAVVAHPERHLDQHAPARLREAVARGALVQATAAPLTDGHDRALIELAEHGLVHVLGSDAHSARAGRPVALSAAFERLAAIPRLAPHIDWIAHTAPAAIVAGAAVEPPFHATQRSLST